MMTAYQLMSAVFELYPKTRIEVQDWEYETNYLYEGYDHDEALEAMQEAHEEDGEIELAWIELIDTDPNNQNPHLGSIKVLIPELDYETGICYFDGAPLELVARKISGQLELPLENIA